MSPRQDFDTTGAFTADVQCKAVEYRLRLPAKTGKGDEAACIGRVELAAASNPFELPDLHPSYVGRRAKYAYTWCLRSETSTFADAIQRIELTEGGSVSNVISFGEGRCAGSPLFVPRGEAEDDGERTRDLPHADTCAWAWSVLH